MPRLFLLLALSLSAQTIQPQVFPGAQPIYKEFYDGGCLCINAGGPAMRSASGVTTYIADQYFSPSLTYADPSLGSDAYQTMRFGTDFSYSFPVAPGFYVVTLRFVEPNAMRAGARTFTVTLQGQSTPPIDLVGMLGPGHPQYSMECPVLVTAGPLTIQFRGVVGNAIVSAIEIRTTWGDGQFSTFLYPPLPN